MWQKLMRLFQKRPTNEQLAIGMTNESLNRLFAHVIALARLQFIEPDVLIREADNIRANAEYILKMQELRKGEKLDKKERKAS